MNWKRKKKTTQENLDLIISKTARLHLRQANFEKQFYDKAARLEKQRTPQEYIR